jgi:hypothetical protein
MAFGAESTIDKPRFPMCQPAAGEWLNPFAGPDLCRRADLHGTAERPEHRFQARDDLR